MPRNSPQGTGEPETFARFGESHLVEKVIEVALDWQRGCVAPSSHSKQLLQEGSAGSVDGLGCHQTHTLQSVELVLLFVEVVLVVGVEL